MRVEQGEAVMELGGVYPCSIGLDGFELCYSSWLIMMSLVQMSQTFC